MAATTRGSSRLYRLATAFYLAIAVAGLVWIGRARGRIGFDLFLPAGGGWIDLGLGLAAAALLLGLWRVTRELLPTARELEAQLASILGPLRRDEALGLAFVSGLAEEVFFRGALQPAVGLWASAALFALLHLGPGAVFRVWSVFALAAGLLFGWMVLSRESLGAAILAHVLLNAMQLARIGALHPGDGPSPGTN